MTGMMMIRAALTERGNPRKKVLIPDSAHGTNPASAVICGYTVETVPSRSDGLTDLEAVAPAYERRRRRADAHQPEHARESSSRTSRRSAASCTRAAASSTWTART